MSWPPDLAFLPVEESARLIALAHLGQASAARARLEDPGDLDALHDFRVSLRRLRNCLQVYEPHLKGSAPRRFRRLFRSLARASGESRDLEVHLAWLGSNQMQLEAADRTGAEWLAERLGRRKQRANEEFLDLARQEFPGLHDRLRDRLSVYRRKVRADRSWPGEAAGQVAGRIAAELAADVLKRLATVHTLSDREQAHRSRVQAKKLRYLLEPYERQIDGGGEAVQGLKRLQDHLGELNDAHAFWSELATALHAASEEAGQSGALGPGAHAATGGTLDAGSPAPGGGAPLAGLLALVPLARSRREQAFSVARTAWIGAGAEALFGRVMEVARALEGFSRGAEIERKYLLSGMPAAAAAGVPVRIEQGWIAGSRIVERFRRLSSKDGVRCYRTVKFGTGVRRQQVEEEVSPALFDAAWPLTAGHRVEKRRYRVSEGDFTWEIDEFLDRPLFLAEVELPAEDSPIEIPAWLQPYLVREVTGDPEYLNVNLGRHEEGLR